jgi:hypothetical protein
MERGMEWNNQAREILKEMIERTGKDYIDICQDLKNIGIDTYTNITLANKINRGTFDFRFFLQVMDVIGMENFNIQINKQDEKIQYLSKDEFVEKFLQLNTIALELNNPMEVTKTKFLDMQTQLYKRAGFDKSIYSNLKKYNFFEIDIFTQALTHEVLVSFYEDLQSENRTLQRLEKLENEMNQIKNKLELS